MICVDASIAVKWLFPEESYSDLALGLLDRNLAADQPIIAPPLLWSEVTNAVRQRMRRDGVSLSRASQLLDQFLALPLRLVAPEQLYQHALLLASRHGLDATYDAQYVVLAQHQRCDLWTDDRHLIANVQPSLPFVRPISEYQP